MPSGVYKRTKEHRDKISKGVKKHLPKTAFCKGNISWYKLHPELAIKGKDHYKWKGGRRKQLGYILIYCPNHPFIGKHRVIQEHRLVVEKHIGRYISPEERVHHLNEIKDDNRPENLMAFVSESAHQRFHHNPNNIKPEEIIFDGRLL